MLFATANSRRALAAALATAAASGVWTAAILILVTNGRGGEVALLLAAELLGSLLARVAERLSVNLRHRVAVLLYAAVRALLVPLVVGGAGVATLTTVSLIAGGAWRVVSAGFIVEAAKTLSGRSRRVATVATVINIGALAGTSLAGVAYEMGPIYWAAGSMLILVALGGRVADREAAHSAEKPRLPVPLVGAAVIASISTSTAARLAPIFVAAALSPAWVGPAAVLAALSSLSVPLLVGRADRWPLQGLLMLAGGAGGVWLVAPYGALVLVAWVVSSLLGGVVDGQLDTRSAQGSDPYAAVARMQTIQAGAGVAGGIAASYVLTKSSVSVLALLSVVIAALGVVALAWVGGRKNRP